MIVDILDLQLASIMSLQPLSDEDLFLPLLNTFFILLKALPLIIFSILLLTLVSSFTIISVHVVIKGP